LKSRDFQGFLHPKGGCCGQKAARLVNLAIDVPSLPNVGGGGMHLSPRKNERTWNLKKAPLETEKKIFANTNHQFLNSSREFPGA